MDSAEGFSALSPAAVGGRRRKMKKVSAKTIRRTLKKMGLKPKGRVVLKGGEPTGESEEPAAPAMGGRRKRSASTRRRSSVSLGRMLGLK
jgi:organic radical activating enzyme